METIKDTLAFILIIGMIIMAYSMEYALTAPVK